MLPHQILWTILFVTSIVKKKISLEVEEIFEMEAEQREQILAKIKAQGDIVRKLKEQKAEKDQVSEWVSRFYWSIP